MREKIIVCLKHRCKFESNYVLTAFENYFYALKCILCILLNLSDVNYDDIYNDIITVAYYKEHLSYSSEFNTMYSWLTICVGKGYFRNWFYCEVADGYP